MTNDLPTEARIIEALILWWRYESQWLPVNGYPRVCPYTMEWRASCQYDDQNGAQESDEIGKFAVQVGHAVDSLPEPYRTAMYTLARNRATGVAVWTSPRLPADAEERASAVAKALDMLDILL